MEAAELQQAGAAKEGLAPADAPEGASPAELKALGNVAWKRQDVAGAVALWNQALRAHVDSMGAGDQRAPPPLSEETASLERSLYLNLAQGLLRLGEPVRALRACTVVLQDSPKDVKARYRAAEAHLALKAFGEASKYATSLSEDGDAATQTEGARLLQRVRAGQQAQARQQRAGQQAEARQQREMAKRMWAAAEGFSDDRQAATAPPRDGPSRSRAALAHMDPTVLAAGTDIAEAAARAARARQARLEREGEREQPLPEPTVPPDLEAFRARIIARTSKYSAAVSRSQQKRQTAQRSLKLQWLRDGQDGENLDAFKKPLQEELESIEAQDREGAGGVEDEGEPAGQSGDAVGGVGEGDVAVACAQAIAEASSVPAASCDGGQGCMDVMD